MTGAAAKSWPEALKREIVAAAFAPGASVSVVARQYDVNTNQVFTWRRRFGNAPDASPPAPQFLPVMVTPDRPAAAPAGRPPTSSRSSFPAVIVFGSGAASKAASLRLVLDALERR